MGTPTFTLPTAFEYLDAVRTLVESRPGFQWENYAGAPAAYRADRRTATVDLADARYLLAYLVRCAENDNLDASLFASRSGGRIAFERGRDGRLECDYTVGQYFPTEYRAAACAYLASVLWDRFREGGSSTAADIRAAARRAFGRRIANRWFR